MKAQALAAFQDTDLTALGLIIFMTVFLGAVFQVIRRSRTELYRELAMLPLGDDGHDEGGRG